MAVAAIVWLIMAWVVNVILERIEPCVRLLWRRDASGLGGAEQRPGRGLWVMALLLVALPMGVMAANQQRSVRLTSQSVEETRTGWITFDPASRYSEYENYGIASQISYTELRNMTDARAFAAKAVSEVRPQISEDEVLQLGTRQMYDSGDHTTIVGWPSTFLLWTSGYARPDPPREFLRDGAFGLDARWRVGSRWDSSPALSWSSPSRAGHQIEYVMATLRISEIAKLTLAVWAAWWTWGYVLNVIDLRSLGRRQRRGSCVACGYSLAGLRG